ncbi:MAG: phage tail sheath protein, partial [Chitinivibrionales bacterium]|nr:phage tail sheath protein [Chitinivibrionales bacterium]MBD3358990.1 phage tail sheath protein [Chitinivibrionales bacterium]
MPQYLAPGVYVEEVSFRPKTIEGVGTTTAGFVGPARFGPISGAPSLLTSFADFERIYGGLDDLKLSGERQVNYLAHGVRAFFAEGGTKLYVSRVFNEKGSDFGLGGSTEIPTSHYGKASRSDSASSDMSFELVARFPGAAGNMRVIFHLDVGDNAYRPSAARLTRVKRYDLVHISTVSGGNRTNEGGGDGLFIADHDKATGDWKFVDAVDSNVSDIAIGDLGSTSEVRPVSILVEVATPRLTSDTFYPAEFWGAYQPDPRSSMALANRFTRNPDVRRDALTVPFAIDGIGLSEEKEALTVTRGLFEGKLGDLAEDNPTITAQFTLTNGDDGDLPSGKQYTGNAADFIDYPNVPDALPKNGLLALAGIDEISMVAAPGHTYRQSEDQAHAIKNPLINHCVELRYRMAILDTPPDLLVGGAQSYRNERSSEYAAMYYPWVFVADPRPGRGGQQLKLPPSGFMAGIYARNDTENAVFKAPANEVVRTALD